MKDLLEQVLEVLRQALSPAPQRVPVPIPVRVRDR